jgi:CRISPR-associated protein Cas2
MLMGEKPMTDTRFIVITYDISNDRRRTRLHKRLKDYGTPVQYSVFECLLDPSDIIKMKVAVRKIIKPRIDHVRYYEICAQCKTRVEVTGRREVTSEAEVIVV